MINIVNSNQGKVQIRKKKQLENDIEPSSCEQLHNVFILCRQSFVSISCERDLKRKIAVCGWFFPVLQARGFFLEISFAVSKQIAVAVKPNVSSRGIIN